MLVLFTFKVGYLVLDRFYDLSTRLVLLTAFVLALPDRLVNAWGVRLELELLSGRFWLGRLLLGIG